MKRLVAIAGTRPEVIKLAPLLHVFEHDGDGASIELWTVRQQGAVLDRALDEWRLRPRASFAFGHSNGRPDAALVHALARRLRAEAPAGVVVQGDTTSALAGALGAHRVGIPCAHVEAGLRSGNERDPYPEESNRVRIAQLAQRHYAPTRGARTNLIAEGYRASSIRVVGNTGIDALLQAIGGIPARSPRPRSKRRILVTGHRRENHGDGMHRICVALARIAERFDDVFIDYVLHPNPQAHSTPSRLLRSHPRIRLVSPLDHRSMVSLLRRSYLVVTDSGGLQEEAPFLGIPLLVTRDRTERPEGLSSGNARLVGSRVFRLTDAIAELLTDDALYRSMSRPVALYGDGRSASRIHADLTRFAQCRAPLSA